MLPTRITAPRESPIGCNTVPLFETSKFPTLRDPLLPPFTENATASVPRRFVASKPRAVLLVIEMTFAVPGVPTVPPGPLVFALPPKTWMPAPAGKFRIVLPLIVAFVRLATADPSPCRMMLIPVPFEVAVLVLLVIVLPVTVALLIVPALFST